MTAVPYPMGVEALQAPAALPRVSILSRLAHVIQELVWFAGFVLLVPLAVLAIGVPIALLVKLVLGLAHIR